MTPVINGAQSVARDYPCSTKYTPHEREGTTEATKTSTPASASTTAPIDHDPPSPVTRHILHTPHDTQHCKRIGTTMPVEKRCHVAPLLSGDETKYRRKLMRL